MKKIIISFIIFSNLALIIPLSNIIDKGLSYEIFNSNQKSIIGDSKIVVIKVDPNFYQLNLLSSDQYNHENLTAKNWSEKYNLTIVINAGMFQEDYSSNVGYMKNFDYINNPYINSYQSVAAFNPKDSTKNKFKIFDIEKKDGIIQKDMIREIINDYESVVQNLRLIKRSKENRWPQKKKSWSEIALGEDKNGNILIIFSRSPYSMHDFNEIIMNLPINLECAQHLEGGPEASLYLKLGDIELAYTGSYESFFFEQNSNSLFWKIPNIIGISKK